ncbi:MAG TPA: hypothetical protein VF024_11185 [Solirubrobacteraceae bacterium]
MRGPLARELEEAARLYAAHSHANMVGDAYRAREAARERLLDALSEIDAARAEEARARRLRSRRAGLASRRAVRDQDGRLSWRHDG